MLKIRYMENFKGSDCLLITGDSTSFHEAASYLQNRTSAFLNDAALGNLTPSAKLVEVNLFLNQNECQNLAEHCYAMALADKPCHRYFETSALPVEIIVSSGEYD